MKFVQLLVAYPKGTVDIPAKAMRLFAATIEKMLGAEMDEHLGYGKNTVLGNNSGNSCFLKCKEPALNCPSDKKHLPICDISNLLLPR